MTEEQRLALEGYGKIPKGFPIFVSITKMDHFRKEVLRKYDISKKDIIKQELNKSGDTVYFELDIRNRADYTCIEADVDKKVPYYLH